MKPNGILRIAGGAVCAAGLATAGVAGVAGAAAGASTPTATVDNDTLFVDGTGQRDLITLRLNAGSTVLDVDFGNDGTADATFDSTTFSQIVIDSASGDDEVRLRVAGEGSTIRTGSGDDLVDSGLGNSDIDTGSGDDFVVAGDGDDTAVLGSGNDTFRWAPGDDNDVIDGRSGRDTLDFIGANIAENMTLSANGERSLFVRDIANVRMDMEDVERLDLAALGGTDTVTVQDMTGTGFRTADIDLAASTGTADGAIDNVLVQGTADDDDIRVETDDAAVEVDGLQATTRVLNSDTTDRLKVNALAGDDTVRVDEAVEALIEVAIAFN